MFEPPAPPKKAGFFKKLFKKKEVPVKTKPQSSFSMEMDVYFQKKLDDIRAKGLPLYTNAELHTLWGFENELVMFVQSFGMAESEKEQPLFENRGAFSYHYEITENDIIIFHVRTAMFTL